MVLLLVGCLLICVFIRICSDKPGQHDFDLLRKLVLPDGAILRSKLPGRPTRDCLFSDPARDGTRYLKNMHRLRAFALSFDHYSNQQN